jgi:putative PIN family toxin of toxin-antitoxin system
MQVVARPSMIDRFDLRESDYLSAMTKLLGAAAQAKFVPLGEIPSIVRDPNDDMVLATAVVSGAEYLVTEDKDLLVLDGYAGIRVCTCRRFMEIAETGFG